MGAQLSGIQELKNDVNALKDAVELLKKAQGKVMEVQKMAEGAMGNLNEHKKVIDQVLEEEIKEIESKEKTNQAMNPD
jgi:hypothetical protein